MINLTVSVIVPVYNVEEYLERCLQSILKQSHKNLEVILVNDGSKDSSGLICDNIKETDSRIKVIHQKNGGLSAARNTGLKYATGDFISFVDSDDWIELSMYEDLLNYAVKYNLDIVECDIQSTMDPVIKRTPNFIVQTKEELALRIIKNQQFSVCRRIYKKDVILKKRFIENYIYEDMMFTSSLLCNLDKVGYINTPYYNYFIENTSSIMHGSYNVKNLKSIDAIDKFQDNIKNCFKSKEILKASKKYVLFFVLHHYQQLFDNKKLDLDYKHRKKIKQIITQNFDNTENNNIYTKIARYCPIWVYRIFHKLEKIRRNRLQNN
ncbi:glycosyltransferase [Algibacter sp. PT7-4]|uniref:glycosyltransferase n=1 Tax=Algibacter ulvanivorans TaxID=3400999 RepID=UPI003AB0BB72